MSGKTYGNLPGVRVTTGGGSVRDIRGNVDSEMSKIAVPGIRLWGHRIVLGDENSIKCEECEMEEEIPDIFQQASPFREVVYKLYLLGKFKNTRCEPELEVDDSIIGEDGTSIGYDPSRVHWSTGDSYTTNGNDANVQIPRGTRMMFDGEEYVYEAHNTFVHTNTGEQFHPVDLTMKHGETALKNLPPNIARDVKKSLKERSKVDKTIDGSITVGDIQDNAGIDHSLNQQAQQPSVTVKMDDITPEEKKSLRKEFAEKLKNTDMNLLTR